ncbi:MAG: hypothetical protein ACKO1Q_02330 [Vulcanococcus sp.]
MPRAAQWDNLTAAMADASLPRLPLQQGPLPTRVRLHFWNSGGAQSVVVPLEQERQRRHQLLAEGAVLLRAETLKVA